MDSDTQVYEAIPQKLIQILPVVEYEQEVLDKKESLDSMARLYILIAIIIIVLYFVWEFFLRNLTFLTEKLMCCNPKKGVCCLKPEELEGKASTNFYKHVNLHTLIEEVYLVKKEIRAVRLLVKKNTYIALSDGAGSDRNYV